MVREGAVPRLTEIERQRKRSFEEECGNQTALHHKTTGNRHDHVYDNTTKCNHVRKSWRSGYLHHPAWVEVSHGWVPVDTHSTLVPILPGRLWVAR